MRRQADTPFYGYRTARAAHSALPGLRLPHWPTHFLPQYKKQLRVSDPKVIGAPVLDALLDLLATQVMFQRLLGQLQHLVIGGKAQAD